MASIRERILESRRAVLDAGTAMAPKPAGLRVHRSRALPIDRDKLPAVVLYCIDEEGERKGGEWLPLAENQLMLRAECRVSSVDLAAVPDTLLDPLITYVERILVGDQSAGGLARRVHRVHVKWDAVVKDQLYAGAGVHFLITYDSAAADPEAQ